MDRFGKSAGPTRYCGDCGRRTALTLPLLPPPQKNRSPPSDSSPEMPTPAGISICSRRRRSLHGAVTSWRSGDRPCHGCASTRRIDSRSTKAVPRSRISFAGSSGETAGLQEADGVDVSLGVSFGGDFNADFSVWVSPEQQRDGGAEYNYRRAHARASRTDESARGANHWRGGHRGGTVGDCARNRDQLRVTVPARSR